MAARTRTDENKTVHALFRRFFRVLHIDDVVEDLSAIGMCVLDDLGRRTERGDDDGHLKFRADIDVM